MGTLQQYTSGDQRGAPASLDRLQLVGGGIDSRGAGLSTGEVSERQGRGATDGRLWALVCAELARAGYGTLSDLAVSVCDGVVTLDGSVDDIPTRIMAEACCLDLPGVRDVQNRLLVRPQERVIGS